MALWGNAIDALPFILRNRHFANNAMHRTHATFVRIPFTMPNPTELAEIHATH